LLFSAIVTTTGLDGLAIAVGPFRVRGVEPPASGIGTG